MAARLSWSTRSLVPASSTGCSPARAARPAVDGGGDHRVGVGGDDDPAVLPVGVDGAGDVPSRSSASACVPTAGVGGGSRSARRQQRRVRRRRRTRRRRRPRAAGGGRRPAAPARRGGRGGDDRFEGADVGHPRLVDRPAPSPVERVVAAVDVASRACRVRAGMPAPAVSSRAARADGAAADHPQPACSKAARTASRVNVLPVPAGPTSTATSPSPVQVLVRRRPGRRRGRPAGHRGVDERGGRTVPDVGARSTVARKRGSTSSISRLVYRSSAVAVATGRPGGRRAPGRRSVRRCRPWRRRRGVRHGLDDVGVGERRESPSGRAQQVGDPFLGVTTRS